MPAEHRWYGPQQNPEIEPERCSLDVVEIVLGMLVHELGSAAGHLPPAGQPLRYEEAAVLPRLVARQHDLDQFRSRAHQAHLAPQHVDELRQLIQAGPAEEAPDPGDPRIVPPLVRPRTEFDPAAPDHGAELQHRKDPSPFADPRLAEQDRSGRIEFDRHRDHRKERSAHQETARRDDEIERPFEPAVPGTRWWLTPAGDRTAHHRPDLLLGAAEIQRVAVAPQGIIEPDTRRSRPRVTRPRPHAASCPPRFSLPTQQLSLHRSGWTWMRMPPVSEPYFGGRADVKSPHIDRFGIVSASCVPMRCDQSTPDCPLRCARSRRMTEVEADWNCREGRLPPTRIASQRPATRGGGPNGHWANRLSSARLCPRRICTG